VTFWNNSSNAATNPRPENVPSTGFKSESVPCVRRNAWLSPRGGEAKSSGCARGLEGMKVDCWKAKARFRGDLANLTDPTLVIPEPLIL
jgi:hypothetical protein